MLWILVVMAAIASLVLAVVVGGLLTPRDHVAARAVQLPVAPLLVWSTIRDVAQYDAWRNELEMSELVDADQPQARWRETSTRGSIAFGITVNEPPTRMTARILDDDLPFTGEWTWQIVATPDGTRVTITERGSVGNPVFRFVGAYVMGHTKSIDGYLASLSAHLGHAGAMISDATPT